MSRFNSLTTAGALAGTLALFASPASTQTGVDALLAAERAVAEASVRDGFAGAILGALAREGSILWPGAPVVSGAEPVRRLLSAQRLLDSVRIGWSPLAVELSSDGTLGVTWGAAVAVRSGAPQLGRYIAAWHNERGTWKLAALVTFGIVPAVGTTLPPDIGPLRKPPLAPTGSAGPFIAADLGFAKLAGDSGAAVAFETFAAPEAVTFGGGILNRGPAAIRRSLEGGPPTTWKWAPVLAGAAASGDLGWTIGESEITPSGSPPRPGKYLTIWRRLPDGGVNYLTDGGNPRPAPP